MASHGPLEQNETNTKQGDTALLLNVGDMIDLAIGTPEVGVVDFNLLQTVLHVLAQQTRLLDKRVELRGNVPAPPPVGRDCLQTINVTEYIIEGDKVQNKIPLKYSEFVNN
ncbi:hypothetical protein EVAR_36392_1 [Eumeta japonica]|uniref:Uncharacterized protein n=1 Tax=Eumeta variegata TaxID=151549 RepID=A0A4C1W798_EUMVA|nr:hypothetical protein EVAR_36392_1 [Eumeta japonica]